MQSGLSGGGGGGAPDFYTAGRSMGNPPSHSQPNNHNNSFNMRSQLQTTTNSSLIDPTSHQQQISRPSLLGKRNLSDLHQTHLQNHHPLNNLFLRSVKPRAFNNHLSSPFSSLDFYSTMSLPSFDIQSQSLPQQRVYSGTSSSALLQQLRHQQQQQQQQQQQTVHFNNGTVSAAVPVKDLTFDSEKQMMDHRLLELEKELLDDNDDDEGSDSASVITNSSSAWCETIYNLISPNPNPNSNPVSTSPTSSASSSASSSSSSVASPSSDCWKQSVMEAATAISEGKLEAVDEILTPVSRVSNSKGNSVQRLTEYMVSALKSRANPVENPPPVTELIGSEHSESTQLLYDVSPCFKLAFMAANLAILEAIEEQDQNQNFSVSKLHVVDFDIGQGCQYVNLLHLLSSSKKGNVSVSLTTVAEIETETEIETEEKLKAVGDSLTELADRIGVSFKFNVVARQKIGELSRESLGCEPGEPLAVNFAFKLYKMADESVSTENPRDELLRRVKGLNPVVVTLMEQEMNMNTAPFVARVAESCVYYGSLFDSIESTVQREHPDRVKLEQGLGRKLANSIACEGRDRIERNEVYGKWRARMGMAGFRSKPMSRSIAELMKNRLSSGYRVNPGFTVKEDNAGICFGWMGRTLTVTSAWS